MASDNGDHVDEGDVQEDMPAEDTPQVDHTSHDEQEDAAYGEDAEFRDAAAPAATANATASATASNTTDAPASLTQHDIKEHQANVHGKHPDKHADAADKETADESEESEAVAAAPAPAPATAAVDEETYNSADFDGDAELAGQGEGAAAGGENEQHENQKQQIVSSGTAQTERDHTATDDEVRSGDSLECQLYALCMQARHVCQSKGLTA